jgi:hypothetical protein
MQKAITPIKSKDKNFQFPIKLKQANNKEVLVQIRLMDQLKTEHVPIIASNIPYLQIRIRETTHKTILIMIHTTPTIKK